MNGSVWRVYEELYPESGPAITVTGRPFDDVTRWKVHQQAPLARLQHLTKVRARPGMQHGQALGRRREGGTTSETGLPPSLPPS